jgi:riboflavin kinase/FMN adenylyltransferase
MKVFRGLPTPDARTPCALAIGNFDGVHRGHRLLLERLRATARQLNVASAVMTFQPHPREYFAQLSGDLSRIPPTIANLRDKLLSFHAIGIDRVIVEHFTPRFAALTAEAFIEEILVQGLQVKWLIVGEDFCFGANRAGRIPALREAGKRHGFQVEVVRDVLIDDQRISSSAVRAALGGGDFARAAELLGHPYTISGHVIHGRQLGRDIGFPTLNLRMAPRHPVLNGIFITRVHGLSEHPLPSVSCIGTRPTVDDSGKRLLETHLLDFKQDCYGKLVKVEFLKKLRDNLKFDGIDALKNAIHGDVAQARAYFAP